MKTKYFKIGESWKKVIITGEEEKRLSEKFVEEYFELFKRIIEKAGRSGFRGTDAFNVSLAVFEKVASPMHYKFDELLELKKDEFMARESK